MIRQKKYLIVKAAALLMGSLMIFSGQALAIKANNQELSNVEILGNSKSIISQIYQEDGISIPIPYDTVWDVLNQTITVVETRVVQNKLPAELVPLVNDALEGAQITFAKAESSAKQGEFSEVSRLLTQGISILSEAEIALAPVDAVSAQAIAKAIARAQEAKEIADGQASSE